MQDLTPKIWLGVAVAGFVASAVLHLGTFTPAAARFTDAHAAALFAATFVPLAAMVVRLRHASAPTRQWRHFRVSDWRRLAALVPPPMRAMLFGAALYALMNLVLSLLLVGGSHAEEVAGRFYVAQGGERHEVTRDEYLAHRAVTLRLASGHLLLFYLVPLVYFRFVDPHRQLREEA
jgi:hypothetical protein